MGVRGTQEQSGSERTQEQSWSERKRGTERELEEERNRAGARRRLGDKEERKRAGARGIEKESWSEKKRGGREKERKRKEEGRGRERERKEESRSERKRAGASLLRRVVSHVLGREDAGGEGQQKRGHEGRWGEECRKGEGTREAASKQARQGGRGWIHRICREKGSVPGYCILGYVHTLFEIPTVPGYPAQCIVLVKTSTSTTNGESLIVQGTDSLGHGPKICAGEDCQGGGCWGRRPKFERGEG